MVNSSEDAARAVDSLMHAAVDDLLELTRIPSLSTPGADPAQLQRAHDRIVEWLREAGVDAFHVLDLPAGTPPVVFGEIPAPEGAPTVLLYSHYDVVPAGPDTEWTTPPFEPQVRDGAVFGRGAAAALG